MYRELCVFYVLHNLVHTWRSCKDLLVRLYSDYIHSFVTFCEYFLPNLGEGKLILNI